MVPRTRLTTCDELVDLAQVQVIERTEVWPGTDIRLSTAGTVRTVSARQEKRPFSMLTPIQTLGAQSSRSTRSAVRALGE